MRINGTVYKNNYAARRLADRVLQRAGLPKNVVAWIEDHDGAFYVKVFNRDDGGKFHVDYTREDVCYRIVRVTL